MKSSTLLLQAWSLLLLSTGCELFESGSSKTSSSSCDVRTAETLQAVRTSIPLYFGPTLAIKGYVGRQVEGAGIKLFRASNEIVASGTGDLIWVRVGAGSTLADELGYVAASDVGCFEPPAAAPRPDERLASEGSCERMMSNLASGSDRIVEFCADSSSTVQAAKDAVLAARKSVPAGDASPVDVAVAGITSACKAADALRALFSAANQGCNAELLSWGRSAGLVGSGLETCAAVSQLFEGAIRKADEACRSNDLRAGIDSIREVWKVSEVLISAGATPLAVVFASYDSGCKVAAATRAYVEWARASCSEKNAAAAYHETSANLCTKLNDMATHRETALPSWCPSRKQGLFYCGVNRKALRTDDGLGCRIFLGRFPLVIGTQSEFVTKAPGGLQRAGDGRLWRETSVKVFGGISEKCFIPDEEVICSL